MKLKTMLALGVAITIATTSMFAGELQGRGASFPGPVYKVWISAYYSATGKKVNYTPTGSGDGIESISKRMVNFAGSDKPLKPKTLAQALGTQKVWIKTCFMLPKGQKVSM